MADTITWKINSISRDSNDKILFISYQVDRKRDDIEYAPYEEGTVGLEGDVTIPFAEVTEAKALEWVKSTLGSEEVTRKETQLAETFLQVGLPWTS